MKVVAYDTSAFLTYPPKKLDEFFDTVDWIVVSDIVWQEMKELKDSNRKTPEIRQQIKKVMKVLHKHDMKIKFVAYKSGILEKFGRYVNNDDRINYCISGAYKDFLKEYGEDLDFFYYTEDLLQYCDACQKYKIPCGYLEWVEEEVEEYTGFKKVFLNDEELASFYEKGSKFDELISNLLINEYIIINNEELFRWNGEDLEKVLYHTLSTYALGDIKPKDIYQRAAIDSFHNNQFTILRGKPGSGKSLLSLAYLFELLEHHKIDKIVIFCNPTCAKDAAKMGYLPGNRNEKVMDSQVGNFLSAKLGRRIVEQLVEKGQLVLLPVSDCRGVDFSSESAGIYVPEAQNLTKELMKLILQRAGDDNKVIVEGDDKTQVDMEVYEGKNNGLSRSVEVFKGENIFGTVTLEKIHRGKIVEIAEKM